MRYAKITFVLLVALMLVILPACQRAATESDAAATFDPLYTSQAQTVEALAAQGVVVGTSLPTNTPGAPAATAEPTATTGAALPSPTVASGQATLAPAAALASGYCDAVGFIADVTVPDGTVFQPNTAFTKTWRLKNIGTCTWSTTYEVTYVSGEPMSAVYPVKLAYAVAPGQTIDVSVNMVAPANNGTFQGFWALKNASGALFGLGSSANVPFWVKIVVGTPSSGGYDFVANAASATWSSQSGALTFPGTEGDSKGFVLKVDNPQLENGTAAGQPGLMVGPNASNSGYIAGTYPDYTVKSGDRFKATINCAYNASGCYVTFRLDYFENGVQKTYWTFKEKYEGLYYNANIDLTPLAGKTVKFMLDVYKSNTYTVNDKAVWVAPRIEGSGTVSPTPIPGTCTDKVAFIADVTVPDNTTFTANTGFTKTWRLKNIGTCTWGTDYKLDYVSGDIMNAVYPVAMPKVVSPGQTVDVSVNLVAPATDGTYKGNWSLKNAGGKLFALGSSSDIPFWVQIKVGTGGATPTPIPGTCTNKAGFIADVTIPDNTTLTPSISFTKTWRLKNTGTCTWGTDYKLDYVSGDIMNAVYPVAMPKVVSPGQTVDISVNLVAPATDGTYKGNWGLKTPGGQLFALGSNADVPFWVQIKVGTGGATPTPVPGSCTNKAAFVADVSVPDNTTYSPNTSFTKTWRLKNAGTCTWGIDYKVDYYSGDIMNAVYPVVLPNTVAPGQTVDVSVNMVAPAANGTYKGNWMLKTPGGVIFGLGTSANVPFYVQIKVAGAAPTVAP